MFGSSWTHGAMAGWDGGVWHWTTGGPGILWLLLVGTILFLLWRAAFGRRRPPVDDAALDALRRQYATGKIDREEFLLRRSTLTGESEI